MIQFYIELKGKLNSEKLWERVKVCDGVNVLDLEKQIWCYGKVTKPLFLQVVMMCLEFTDHIKVEVTAH